MPRPTSVLDQKQNPATRTVRNQELSATMRATTRQAKLTQLANQLVEENIPVADALASRYSSRGIAIEDLRQVARLALVRASQAFKPEMEQDFLSYAVPCIRGELRRHFRDAGWVVRPPRRVQEAQYRIHSVSSDLNEKFGRDATPQELSEELGLDDKTVTEALTLDGCFHPESLDRPVDVDGGGLATLGDRLAGDSADLELCETRIVLAPLLAQLSPRDARVLHLRFFEGLTQREVGDAIGVTQMQVSRILSRVLAQLRDQLTGADESVASEAA